MGHRNKSLPPTAGYRQRIPGARHVQPPFARPRRIAAGPGRSTASSHYRISVRTDTYRWAWQGGGGAIGLDQIYTKPAVADRCFGFLLETLGGLRDLRSDRIFYVEPSAGEGCFFDLLPRGRRVGIDIEPRRAGILRCDFLTWPFESTIEDPQQTVVVGNPPFGHRSRLAIRFFNRAAAMANTIGFVVPVQFRKYSVHKNLRSGFRWIATMELDGPSFYTRSDPDYRLNAEFQVWTREANHDYEDMRLLSPPAIRHADFEMWQYNNTPGALKVFEHDFDFAVPRQGYQDYSRRETSADRCERTKQWILFKAGTPAVLDRLMSMDFAALSQNNTITPGFGKADVVKEYVRITGQENGAGPPTAGSRNRPTGGQAAGSEELVTPSR